MTDRLEKLLQMLQREPDDLFLLYAIAMEHKKTGAYEPALEHLNRVIAKDPLHCAAHHQLAQVLEISGDLSAARQAYQTGVAAALRAGNQHAAEEMSAALSMLGE